MSPNGLITLAVHVLGCLLISWGSNLWIGVGTFFVSSVVLAMIHSKIDYLVAALDRLNELEEDEEPVS